MTTAPDLPPYCAQVSSTLKTNQISNIVIVSTKDSKIVSFCLYVDEIKPNTILIHPKLVPPEEEVKLDFVYVEPSKAINKISIKAKFKFSLIGLPAFPHAQTYYSYHGRLYSFCNESEESGFISIQTAFQTQSKTNIDEITELPIEKTISDRIIKMIHHRKTIITKSLLIVGNCGSGKTFLTKHMCKNVSKCVSLNLLKFISDLENSKFDYLESVLLINDGVLLIDDICTLSPQIASILVEKLITSLEHKSVIIIGTSRYPPYSLPVPLQSLFSFAMSISSLRHEERRSFLSKFIPENLLDFAVRETSGISRGELSMISKIVPDMISTIEQRPQKISLLLKTITTSEKPMQLRTTSDAKIHVSGYHQELDEIRLFLRVSFSDDTSLLQYSGIMLTGASGNGKSHMIRALSEEFEVPFFMLEFDKVFSRYLGESERAIRDVFAAARFFAPCAVIIEDIDAIGAKRSDESGVGGRVLSTLLNEIDGISKKSKVLLIATTNSPEIVDSALMRPGRFDKIIEIGNPKEGARLEMFQFLREKTPLADDVTNEWLVSLTNDFTCAEIQSFFRFSALQALRESKPYVTKDYFELGLKRVQERKSSQKLRNV